MPSDHPKLISFSIVQYTVATQLDDKADDTKKQAHQKEIDSRLHVVQFEAVISIERVNDSFLMGIYINSVHTKGNPVVVNPSFYHTINNFSNSLHQWVAMKH
jgi:hypothetical protein